MDIWEVLVVLIAFIAAAKWYTWCQMCYWSSPKRMDDWAPMKINVDKKHCKAANCERE